MHLYSTLPQAPFFFRPTSDTIGLIASWPGDPRLDRVSPWQTGVWASGAREEGSRNIEEAGETSMQHSSMHLQPQPQLSTVRCASGRIPTTSRKSILGRLTSPLARINEGANRTISTGLQGLFGALIERWGGGRKLSLCFTFFLTADPTDVMLRGRPSLTVVAIDFSINGPRCTSHFTWWRTTILRQTLSMFGHFSVKVTACNQPRQTANAKTPISGRAVCERPAACLIAQ